MELNFYDTTNEDFISFSSDIIKKKIIDFGDGTTEFYTGHIDGLLRKAEQLQKENEQLFTENSEKANEIVDLSAEVGKLRGKYKERLTILKENKNKKIPHDNYPYDFDLKCQKEFLKDLNKLLKEE